MFLLNFLKYTAWELLRHEQLFPNFKNGAFKFYIYIDYNCSDEYGQSFCAQMDRVFCFDSPSSGRRFLPGCQKECEACEGKILKTNMITLYMRIYFYVNVGQVHQSLLLFRREFIIIGHFCPNIRSLLGMPILKYYSYIFNFFLFLNGNSIILRTEKKIWLLQN